MREYEGFCDKVSHIVTGWAEDSDFEGDVNIDVNISDEDFWEGGFLFSKGA